jgi:hypothetical protein
MPMHAHSGVKPKCCNDRCADMASCFSPAAMPPLVSLQINVELSHVQFSHRIGGFVPPDPDRRLRPPTALLG